MPCDTNMNAAEQRSTAQLDTQALLYLFGFCSMVCKED